MSRALDFMILNKTISFICGIFHHILDGVYLFYRVIWTMRLQVLDEALSFVEIKQSLIKSPAFTMS
jgi:hypothetical protein